MCMVKCKILCKHMVVGSAFNSIRIWLQYFSSYKNVIRTVLLEYYGISLCLCSKNQFRCPDKSLLGTLTFLSGISM